MESAAIRKKTIQKKTNQPCHIACATKIERTNKGKLKIFVRKAKRNSFDASEGSLMTQDKSYKLTLRFSHLWYLKPIFSIFMYILVKKNTNTRTLKSSSVQQVTQLGYFGAFALSRIYQQMYDTTARCCNHSKQKVRGSSISKNSYSYISCS